MWWFGRGKWVSKVGKCFLPILYTFKYAKFRVCDTSRLSRSGLFAALLRIRPLRHQNAFASDARRRENAKTSNNVTTISLATTAKYHHN